MLTFRDVVRDLGLTYAEVAAALDCSVASVRAYMLPDESRTNRAPPKDWRRMLIVMLKRKATRYSRTAVVLESDAEEARLDRAAQSPITRNGATA